MGDTMGRLEELLNCLTKEHVVIQMHNYPDQDALASAMALKVLLEAKGKQALICYKGIIDKENTLKMVELLGIDIHEQRELQLSEKDEIIIVDGQKGNINVMDMLGEEVACIDHHMVSREETYRYKDIRSNVGACASIMAEYFFESGVEMPQNVATALLYGIRMDTHNMTRGVSALDLEMFSKLYLIANSEHLKTFESYCLKLEDLEAYRKAIDTLKVKHGLGVAAVVPNCSEALMASVSDFLLTLSSVSLSLVYSYRAGGVKFSVRSSSEELDARLMIQQALKGIGDGGGHQDMAAGFIPNVPDEETAMQYAATVEQRFVDMLA